MSGEDKLEGIERFEAIIAANPLLASIGLQRGQVFRKRIAPHPIVDFDRIEECFVILCGNESGWQLLGTSWGDVLDKVTAIANACLDFSQAGIKVTEIAQITLVHRNLIRAVDLKEAMDNLLKKREEERVLKVRVPVYPQAWNKIRNHLRQTGEFPYVQNGKGNHWQVKWLRRAARAAGINLDFGFVKFTNKAQELGLLKSANPGVKAVWTVYDQEWEGGTLEQGAPVVSPSPEATRIIVREAPVASELWVPNVATPEAIQDIMFLQSTVTGPRASAEGHDLTLAVQKMFGGCCLEEVNQRVDDILKTGGEIIQTLTRIMGSVEGYRDFRKAAEG